MKKAFRITIGILCAFAVIFLLVTVQYGFFYKVPDRIQVTYEAPATIDSILRENPQLKLTDPDRAVFSTGGTVMQSMRKVLKMPGVTAVNIEPERPAFYWSQYFQNVERIVHNFTLGDFGLIFTKTSSIVQPLAKELGPMIARTSGYFFAALGTAYIIGIAFPLVATKFRLLGWLFDGIHKAMLALPDFLVISLITYLAIFVSKYSSERLILIMQLNKEVPFLIPYLTIALIPSVMIYGTVRDALKRELERPYIATALAKGMSRTRVIVFHALRNTMEDLFAVLPRATTAAISSMIIAEVGCSILGLGGFLGGPYTSSPGAIPVICLLLASVSFLIQGIYALFRKGLVVSTKEADV